MVTTGVTHWVRRNPATIVAAVGVLVALLTAGSLVLAIADSEDELRDAETGYAELGLLAAALERQPIELISRQHHEQEVDLADLVRNRRLRARAVGAATLAESNWGNSESRAIVAGARHLAALSGRALRAARAEESRVIRALLPRLRAANVGLTAEVRDARRRLDSEADARESQATRGMLLVMGIAGALIAGLMFGVAGARRRRVAGEAKQAALRRSEQRLRTLVQHGSDMITVVSSDTTVIYEAGAVRSLLGYEPSELEGRKLSEWVHPDDIAALLTLCASANGDSAAHELRFRHRDGSLRTCEARATSLLGDEIWDGIVLNVWDVSERKSLEERLRHEAFHDSLTGLPNRSLFANRLEHALSKGARAERAVTVLLVDLDDFKAINDSFGHSAGDLLLREVAGRLEAAMRDADTVARLGGDEFAVILEGSSSRYADEAAARGILQAVEEPFEVGGRSFPISASVGIARSGAGELTADQLVRNADLAMYTAKGRRRPGWAIYREDMHFSVEERLQLKADFAHAVASMEQFELFYQPIIGLQGGEIYGFEALLRWNHPTRGRVSPHVFIPLAEESGAIVPVGRWVLREACRQLRDWEERTGKRVVVGVNASARQIATPGIVGDVRRALREFGLDGPQLVIELTETELVRNQESAIEVLCQVKELDVWVAIDDFGTGYSSLSQLESLPVDVLKVDRGFASSTQDPANRRKLLRAVTELANALDLRVVAEGIETSEQLADLRSLNIPLGQGFLFSPPVPAAEVEVLLRQKPVAEANQALQPVARP